MLPHKTTLTAIQDFMRCFGVRQQALDELFSKLIRKHLPKKSFSCNGARRAVMLLLLTQASQ